MKRLLTLTIISSLSGLGGCRQSISIPPADQPVPAQTFVVRPVDRQATISVAGVVKAHLEADLAAPIVARVASVAKHEGDHCRRGEVLVRLHAPALGAGVAQANAALASAEKQEQAAAAQATFAADTLSRYAQLRERHSVTSYELDQVKAQSAAAQAQQQSAAGQVSAARSALAIQQANAADANVYAPFDGVVTHRLVDPGALAAPGVPLLHLQSTGETDVEFSAPESLLNSLHAGTNLAVSLGSGTPLEARVATISPAGDAGSHSFTIKAILPTSSAWNAGTVVRVSLPSQRAVASVLVPSSALVPQGGLDAVIAVDANGRGAVRYVTLGEANGGLAEILTGVRPGDRVLSDGNLAFAGKKIEARR